MNSDKAISLMKISTYIVNSFIATGYDTLDITADLTNEDITKIEVIIIFKPGACRCATGFLKLLLSAM